MNPADRDREDRGRKTALEGGDLMKIRGLALDLHAMVHPAEISGRNEKTFADFVWDYMMKGNRNEFVRRETWDTDLKYAGSKTVPVCWLFWHTYRIEDLVGGMILTPMTSHHMMHLPTAADRMTEKEG